MTALSQSGRFTCLTYTACNPRRQLDPTLHYDLEGGGPTLTDSPWLGKVYITWFTAYLPGLWLTFQIWARRSTYRKEKRGRNLEHRVWRLEVWFLPNEMQWGRRRSWTPSLNFNKGVFSPMSHGLWEKHTTMLFIFYGYICVKENVNQKFRKYRPPTWNLQ